MPFSSHFEPYPVLFSTTLRELTEKYAELKDISDQKTIPAVTKEPVRKTLQFITSDSKVRTYTGLISVQAFEDLHQMVNRKASQMRYWSGSQKSVRSPKRAYKKTPQKPEPSRKLTMKEELLMTLMKLKLGVINQLLADKFGVLISLSVVSQILNTWIKFLADELSPLIFWPSKDMVRDTLPKTLQGTKYMNLRCTIDCTEVFIERPRHLATQAITWSDYKHHNTVKFLVGIAPDGHISFLSAAWGGRASD